MDAFQKTTLVIASVILMICLVFEGVILSNKVGSQVYPPSVGNCPDYWLDVCGNGTVCIDKYNPNNSITFPVGVSTCNQYIATTAGQYGYVPWDGINYGVPNPCS